MLYPCNPPTPETHKQVTLNGLLVCPGCTRQDIELCLCHGTLLEKCCGTNISVRGMHDSTASGRKDMLDTNNGIFIGRAPPRGMATRSADPPLSRKLKRSIYANPFIVKKGGGFTLGESLALYSRWIDNEFRPISAEVLVQVVGAAREVDCIEMLAVRRDGMNLGAVLHTHPEYKRIATAAIEQNEDALALVPEDHAEYSQLSLTCRRKLK